MGGVSMHDYRRISRLMERNVHKYVQLENRARFYGGVRLSQTEVHTIAVIGDYPDINITKLSGIRGITKGATSQMIYKLVDKGLVVKTVSPNSDTEVCLNLTRKGVEVYEAHKKFHDETNERFFQMLREMPEGYEQYMIKFLKEFEKMLEEKMDRKEG